jgi:hypothetical protein
MEKKANVASRRNFLFGLLAGAGAATVVAASRGKAVAKERELREQPETETLYRRTAEAERYYKTLYH